MLRLLNHASLCLFGLLAFSALEASAQTAKPASKPAATKPAPAKPAAKSAATPAKPATTAARGAPGAVGPAAPMPRVYAPTRPREVQPKYSWKEDIVATIFWIGEAPTANNPTPNHASSWDTKWQINYGGYDDPNREARAYDFRPKAFVPKLNPFYIALPFNDKYTPQFKSRIPWAGKRAPCPVSGSYCRGTWIAIRYGNKTCFAQWEDCGPFEKADVDYVFGNARPKNAQNNGAGIDVSPAVRDYLGMSSGAAVDWRFCTEEEVPDGPWTRFGMNNTFNTKERRELEALRARYAELVRQREEYLKRQR